MAYVPPIFLFKHKVLRYETRTLACIRCHLHGDFSDTRAECFYGHGAGFDPRSQGGVFVHFGGIGWWCGVVLVALSLFGVGAILAASSELFQVVKWGGVLYMAYLGLGQILEARRGGHLTPTASRQGDGMASARAGFFTAVLNPKAIIFYVAFLSQFLDPSGSIQVQFVIVVATSTVIVGVVLGGYALLASRARKSFQSAKARRRFGYAGGGFLLGGSAFMALNR